ncbi:MAG: type II secretion system protein GspE, partial [candidate division NC10 bacterium]
APSTISRLLNMGVEPFLVAASTNVIVAQRLARRVCQQCKEPAPVPPQVLVNLGFSPEDAKTIVPVKGKGCMTCSETGYKGRVALYEVLVVRENIKEGILQGASVIELRELGRKNGMKTLREAGLQKLREGMTSLEELMRVTTGN